MQENLQLHYDTHKESMRTVLRSAHREGDGLMPTITSIGPRGPRCQVAVNFPEDNTGKVRAAAFALSILSFDIDNTIGIVLSADVWHSKRASEEATESGKVSMRPSEDPMRAEALSHKILWRDDLDSDEWKLRTDFQPYVRGEKEIVFGEEKSGDLYREDQAMDGLMTKILWAWPSAPRLGGIESLPEYLAYLNGVHGEELIETLGLQVMFLGDLAVTMRDALAVSR